MRKILTIFDRNWNGDRKCIDKLIVDEIVLNECFATEKIDGTNIRITMRSGHVMRVEKRRNPNKEQKLKGITEPWYVEASRNDNQDKWIFDAVDSSDLTDVPDGEWSAEAFGRNIQGNPLNIETNMVFVFGCPSELEKIKLAEVPIDYRGISEYLGSARSIFNTDSKMEGIVWHGSHGDMFKIKLKDFVK